MFSLSAVCRLFLVFFVLVGPGCQLLPVNSARLLAGRFVQALQGQSDVRVDAFLAPDAEVFLQGAPTPLSGARFQEYIVQLKRNHQEFQAASRVFLTTTGAGWLLSINSIAEQESAYPPGPPIPPQLWMEASIRDGQITRVWIHFTVEALPRMAVNPEAYRGAAASRGMPVPDGWLDGTPAMLAAAERTDRLADGGWSDTSTQLLIVVSSVLGLVVGFAAFLLRRRTRPQQTVRKAPGALLENLRKAHSAADAVR